VREEGKRGWGADGEIDTMNLVGVGESRPDEHFTSGWVPTVEPGGPEMSVSLDRFRQRHRDGRHVDRHQVVARSQSGSLRRSMADAAEKNDDESQKASHSHPRERRSPQALTSRECGLRRRGDHYMLDPVARSCAPVAIGTTLDLVQQERPLLHESCPWSIMSHGSL